MDYITTQKFSLRNQPFIKLYGATVLLVEPELETCAVYSRQLEGVNMNVITCGTLEEMLAKVESQTPDIIIVNPTANVLQGIRFVSLLKAQYPSLPVITMAHSMLDSYIDDMMKAGVSFHINRQLTQPRDILLAVEQLLS